MPVVVRLGGSARVEKTHDQADDIAVDDVGCLVVTAGSGKEERTVAIYAPGVWALTEVR